MKKFTVLLLYPDDLADQYGEETYLAWVEAEDAPSAILKAQNEALRANGSPAGSRREDFRPLFACAGHQPDLVAGLSPTPAEY